MGGWKFEWAGQLPADVYDAVVAMMHDAAQQREPEPE